MTGSLKDLLITGGCGFIGSNFIRFVLAARPTWRVHNLDALTYSGNAENLADLETDPRYQFTFGDINDDALVGKLVGECDVVVHFAAESHVDRSILDARPFVQANVLGTQCVLDAVLRAGTGRFVHISTDEVRSEERRVGKECRL